LGDKWGEIAISVDPLYQHLILTAIVGADFG
jgi:multisubunit Na+/H+ antiporter MnhC subunit